MYACYSKNYLSERINPCCNCGDKGQLVGRVHLWYVSVIIVPSPPEVVRGMNRVRPVFDLGKLL